MKPEKRSRAMMAIAVIVALSALLLWKRPRAAAEARSALERDPLSISEVAGDGSSSPAARTKHRVDSPSQAPKSTDAAASVLSSMYRDEHERSRFVSEKKAPAKTIYTFEIKRREDLDKFVRELCKSSAEAAGSTSGAVAVAVDDYLGQFDIPEGCIQRVAITIPDDPSQEVGYLYFNVKEGQESDPSRLVTVGQMGSGTTGRDELRWRYSHLLELNPKAAE